MPGNIVKVLLNTYLVPVGAYDYVNPYAPTSRQLAYIESLGGNSRTVGTKKEASKYIDRLKSGNTRAVRSSSPEKPYFETIPGQIVKVLLIFVAVIVGWIVVLR